VLLPTLRESPAGVETIAERLLVRAGYARAISAGVYAYLPLGIRSLARLQRIVREELERSGGQETLLDPATAAAIARGELRSPKQLPQLWYRLETPLLRLRQLAGLDVYPFGVEPGAVAATLGRILERAGVSCAWSQGGAVVLRESGPDTAAVCPGCAVATDLSVAESVPTAALPDIEGDLVPEPFHTPGQKTIADLARFTGQPESMQMKSLVLVASGKPVLVMLRGDHQLSEAKFATRSGDAKFRPAAAEELVRWFGASAGSLGPVGVTSMPIWMDTALAGRRNMVAGANRDDYHLRHVTPGEDFQAEIANLRETAAGDGCRACGASLELRPAVELARFGEAGARLSLERLLTAAVEAGHDQDGMVLPAALAPFDVIVTDAGAGPAAEAVYRAITEAGYDALLDDRDERAGVKFKDADLVGVPWRVTVGKKASEGVVELVNRRTRSRSDVPIDGIVKSLREAAQSLSGTL
jgi:prolyl-tRNA synthetase